MRSEAFDAIVFERYVVALDFEVFAKDDTRESLFVWGGGFRIIETRRSQQTICATIFSKI